MRVASAHSLLTLDTLIDLRLDLSADRVAVSVIGTPGNQVSGATMTEEAMEILTW